MAKIGTVGNLNPVMLINAKWAIQFRKPFRPFPLLVLESYYLLHPGRYSLCNSLNAGGGETPPERGRGKTH